MGCGSSAPPPEAPNALASLKKKPSTKSYKLVILGDASVGKTSILNYLLNNTVAKSDYSPTIGFAFSSKLVKLESGEEVSLQLWDTWGQEEARELVSVYYRDSHAALIVFDYSNVKSVEGVLYWLKKLEDKVNTKSMVIKIVGNKADLKGAEGGVRDEDLARILEGTKDGGYERIDTSALTGLNVVSLFDKVAKECFERFR